MGEAWRVYRIALWRTRGEYLDGENKNKFLRFVRKMLRWAPGFQKSEKVLGNF